MKYFYLICMHETYEKERGEGGWGGGGGKGVDKLYQELEITLQQPRHTRSS